MDKEEGYITPMEWELMIRMWYKKSKIQNVSLAMINLLHKKVTLF